MKTLAKILSATVALSVIASNVYAQESSTVRKPAATKATEVRVNRIEMKSAAPEIPVLVVNKSARSAPQWAKASLKPAGSGNNAGMSLAAPPKGELKNLTLTVRRNYTSLGNLSFHRATVSAANNYAFWHNLDTPEVGYTMANLHVKKGKRYLIDFDITASEFSTFGINAGDTVQDITVNPGDHHLLAYVDATETGEIVVVLNSNTATHTFRSLKVSRVD